ncbi:MAG TPA: penicillin-binding transpeptidase domain-containing protein, partial [Acidimicrobiales bacterium]|nr:penicillin-binding transpeptidase domain-containing protein [Acidimicrobiales bacterium]
TTPHLGLGAYGGNVSQPASPVDLAADAIGQGGVTMSPLAMAVVAATVDSGALHEPRLVSGAPDDSVAPAPLDPTVDTQLKTLMAQVVTSPAGTAAQAGLPAGTYGKTGTAEFGSGPNPPEHAWFIGFRGDVAFAVFVYGGGVGGTVAAPLAAKLLKTLGTYNP